MFNFADTETEKMKQIIAAGAKTRLTDEKIIVLEIERFKASKPRRDMLDGERYFAGNHDILDRKRTVIGEGGMLQEVNNLPNNRIVDNQYRKMVSQKNNYLLGQPIVFKAANEQYNKQLKQVFGKNFMRLMKNIGKDALNSGLGWLFLHYDEHGELIFRRFKASEIIPGWRDSEHSELEYAIRIYEVVVYEGRNKKRIEKVEVYDNNGIHRFVLEGGRLVPDEVPHEPYFIVTGVDGKQNTYNWLRIPLIPFRYNSEETPLIRNLKSLQDGLNLIISNFQNNLEEDARNTILVLVNYDGENLGDFRKNLATYGAVKVRTIDGAAGDLRTLQVEVNSENYKTILQIFKKAIIENAMGYDAKDDRVGGNPNQMNIQSMYSDIDLDANETETEFQASFEKLLWFVNAHLAHMGQGDFDSEAVEIIFNRDILINENEAIDGCQKSVGILSGETIVSNHPWVDDPQEELKRLGKERQDAADAYRGAFPDAGGAGSEK